MTKTKFDILVEHILNISEGRKPKQYNKLVIDFEKLENDINGLSSDNPFKKIYQFALNNMKSVGDDSFTYDELANDPKTLPEWEEAFYNAFHGGSLSNLEKRRFGERFFNFAKDPDREYFSEYVGSVDGGSADKHVESMQQHIFDYVNQAEKESASKDEIISYIGRYGHEPSEVSDVIAKMVEDGQLRVDGDQYFPQTDPSLDAIDPEDSELTGKVDPDDMEAFRDDVSEDEESSDGRISDDIAKELGIDVDDPFGDKEFDLDNLTYADS